jgi:hypothetical protein
VISGTPTTTQNAANYTITATNSGGSTTKTISIKVNAIVTASLSEYPYQPGNNDASEIAKVLRITFSEPAKITDAANIMYSLVSAINYSNYPNGSPVNVNNGEFGSLTGFDVYIGHTEPYASYGPYYGMPGQSEYNTKYSIFIYNDSSGLLGENHTILTVNLTLPEGYGVAVDGRLSQAATINNFEVLSNNW